MDSLSLFFLASLAVIFTPGPDIIYVLSRGIADGKWAGVVSALGVTAGILVHTLAAALGLAVLLQTSVVGFWALKIIGGVYLIYIGYQIFRNKETFEISGVQDRFEMRRCFTQGFLSNVLNPKVAIFFVAFLPQFVSANGPSASVQMIAFGLIFALMGLVFLVALGAFAGRIGAWLKDNPVFAGCIQMGSGGLLMLLGVRMLVPERR